MARTCPNKRHHLPGTGNGRPLTGPRTVARKANPDGRHDPARHHRSNAPNPAIARYPRPFATRMNPSVRPLLITGS